MMFLDTVPTQTPRHFLGQTAVEQVPGVAAVKELRLIVEAFKSRFVGEEASVFNPDLTASQEIHVLGVDVDQPDERAIVITQAESTRIGQLKDEIVQAIQGTGKFGDAFRTLLAQNAMPGPLPGNAERWITQAQNLLQVYNDHVFAVPTKERVSGWAIAGGIFLGLIGLAAMTYALGSKKPKPKRRRR